MIVKIHKDWVTISEFENLTGLNNRTILSAIKRGLIPEDCIARKDTDFVPETSLFDDVPVEQVEPKSTTKPYFINPHPAAEHWCNHLNSNRPASYAIREKLEKYIITFNPDFMNRNKDDPPDEDESDSMSYKEAVRKERVAKAKIAELELKEKEGSLVQKSVVYDRLFSFGQEIRNALLMIPERITDSIIAAAGNRTKTLNLINDAIAGELERLSNINTIIK